jgi:phosphopantetheinyl transferase (holo-ACP synthase)
MSYSLLIQTCLTTHDQVFICDKFAPKFSSAMDHPITRAILSNYLGRTDIAVTKTQNGKPMVVMKQDEPPLFISLSHAQNILVIMLSLNDNIGIDVEAIKLRKYLKKISQRYFNSDNMEPLEFYRHFTAKESYIKAVDGQLFRHLAMPLIKDESGFIINDNHKTFHISFIMPAVGFLLAVCQQHKKSININII